MDESKKAPAKAQVWLVSGAKDLAAMHDGIAIYSGGGCRLLHCAQNPEPGRPAQAVLAAAGFGGAPPQPARVESADIEGAGLTKLRGFEVDEGRLADVEIAARQALSGALGGFLGVLTAQVGFHRAFAAFEYTWVAAGKPRVLVPQPGLPPGSRGASGPGRILPAAALDGRVRSTLASVGELPEDAES